jgi:hypothetical protein
VPDSRDDLLTKLRNAGLSEHQAVAAISVMISWARAPERVAEIAVQGYADRATAARILTALGFIAGVGL